MHADAKSHSGITIFLGATLFKSYKIKMLNKSVAESELSVLSDVTSLLVHEREFAIVQQLIDAFDNVLIHENNTAAIHLVKKTDLQAIEPNAFHHVIMSLNIQ